MYSRDYVYARKYKVLFRCVVTFYTFAVRLSLWLHTHTHNRFTAGLEYVRVHPGQQVPER